MSGLNHMQRFFIKHHTNLTLNALFYKTGAEKVDIQRYLDYLKARSPEGKKTERKLKKTVENPVDNLMIKNKKRGVVVMTPEASAVGDTIKKKTSTRWDGNVTKIRPE